MIVSPLVVRRTFYLIVNDQNLLTNKVLFLEGVYSIEYIYIIYSIEYIVKGLLQYIYRFFEELKMGFPERLKELRLKKGLTQKEIAEEFGIKQPNYQQWESGKRKPSSETLEKFANFFGVTMDYLSGNDEKLENVEFLFRMNSQGLTDEEKETFRKELIEFMEERKKLFQNKP